MSVCLGLSPVVKCVSISLGIIFPKTIQFLKMCVLTSSNAIEPISYDPEKSTPISLVTSYLTVSINYTFSIPKLKNLLEK